MVEQAGQGPAWLRLADEHWRACIAEGVEPYMAQLQRARNGTRLKFNGYACLFGFAWLFFRKMYLVAGCALLLFLASYTVLMFLNVWLVPFEEVRVFFAVIWFAGPPILFGLYGDRVYLWHVARIIQAETEASAFFTPQQLAARLGLKGGTSWTSVFALIGGILAFFWMIGKVADR